MVHYMTQSDYCSIIWRTLLHAEPLEDSEKLSCSIIGEGIERAEVEAAASFQLHVPSDRSLAHTKIKRQTTKSITYEEIMVHTPSFIGTTATLYTLPLCSSVQLHLS